jgi:hypothetical protein
MPQEVQTLRLYPLMMQFPNTLEHNLYSFTVMRHTLFTKCLSVLTTKPYVGDHT